MDVNHCSVYQLTLEPHTFFYKHPPSIPGDDQCWDMEQWIKDSMFSSGYRQYEVSAFAKNGLESTHNKNYWKFGDYLGIGAGAHSKISYINRIMRVEKSKSPQSYIRKAIDGSAVAGSHQVSPVDLPGEFMMNALRLKGGFNLNLFSERTGLDLDYVMPAIEKSRDQNLVILEKNFLTPTDLGYRFLNSLIDNFI